MLDGKLDAINAITSWFMMRLPGTGKPFFLGAN